jgi:uncharacterized RDD family membrane protein YckC
MAPPGPIDRVFGAIVPRAVDAVDLDDVLGHVDVDLMLSRVDIDALLQRVDVNALVQRVDVDALIQRVDVDALIQRVDVDALVQRVDVDALIQRVDVDDLVRRAQIDRIVRTASRGVFARLTDAVRRQLVGLDALLIGTVARLFRRPREDSVIETGTVTGRTAGGVSRLAAFLVDVTVISFSYTMTVALISYLFGLFTGHTVDTSKGSLLAFAGYLLFAFLYIWIGLSVTGRSIGKGLVGLRVVAVSGAPISPGRAAVRTIVYPFSFILGLGLIPIVTGRQRRALHDFAAGDKEIYDWGDRPAELPAPLTAWVRRHSPGAAETPPVAPPTEGSRT